MPTEFSHYKNRAFSVRSKRIRRIVEALKDASQEIRISAECRDNGAQRQFSRLDDLLDYENQRDKRILTLSIDSYMPTSAENWVTANVRWRTDIKGKEAHISVRVRGRNEEHALRLYERLCEIMSGTKPWYSLATRIDWPFFFIVLVAAYASLMLVAGTYDILTDGALRKSATEPRIPDATALAYLSFFLAPYFLISGFLVWVRRRVFPAGVFSIGQESKRDEIRDWARKWSLGILATALAGLAAKIAF